MARSTEVNCYRHRQNTKEPKTLTGSGQVRARWVEIAPDRLKMERALWLLHKPHAPMHHWTIWELVRNYGERAGIKRRVTPHLWRHTCATHLLSNGASAAHVQRMLGHHSLETTQLYVRVTIPEVKAAYRKAHPRA